MMNSEAMAVHCISRSTIKPYFISEENKEQQTYCLTPWDLCLLSAHYIQFGLLFAKPPSLSGGNDENVAMITTIDRLKHSLSLTLGHFFPLSGRLVTYKHDNPPSYSVSLDCRSNSQGVEFMYASAVVTIADILSPLYVPPIVESFFISFNGRAMVNHDGLTVPLLAIQVTELVDGFFVGCSFNHVVGDGTSFWNFFNTWAEICRTKGNMECISHQPIIKRWFPEETEEDHTINLPFFHHDEFIKRYPPPPLKERIFHFSAQSIARLKAQANDECCTDKISSFQALSALVWRSVTRARCVHAENETTCKLLVNDRLRLNPPLSKDYFGCYAEVVGGTTKAGELLDHSLGLASWILHEAVASRTDQSVRDWLTKWMKDPSFLQVGPYYNECNVIMGGSPRFDVYGCDFGWGKPRAVRSGWGYKFNGNVWAYPGREGRGSIDLEVCLSPAAMSALESDEELMKYAF